MIRRAIGGAAFLAVVVMIVIWRLSSGTEAPKAAAQTPAPGIPVTAGTVAAQNVPVFLQGIGTVQAYNMVAIKSRVDGQIVKVDFKEGQDIKAGDPLLSNRSAAVPGGTRAGAGGETKRRGTVDRRPTRSRSL